MIKKKCSTKNTLKFLPLQTNAMEPLVSGHSPLVYGLYSTQIRYTYHTVTSWENKGYNVTLAQTKGF